MKVIKTSNFLNKTLLLAISCFFIINTNAIGNLSYLDILLILYILKYALSVKSFRLKKRTVKIMYVLNLFIALSVVFIPFANEKIENLAFDVGFNTSSAFYSAFKKETSMSPRTYQKTYLGL